MAFETLKKIGELQKNKSTRLSVSVSRMTDGERIVDFVGVQELVYNEDKDRYEYSKKGYTVNVNLWSEFMELMYGVSRYLGISTEPEQEQETIREPKSSGPSKPKFMER